MSRKLLYSTLLLFAALAVMGADDTVSCDAWVILEGAPAGPKAVISAPSSGDTFTAGNQIRFDGSQSSAEDGRIVDYEWRFSDDGREAGSVVEHTFWKYNRQRATLTVTDGNGRTDSATVRLTIRNPPPTADLQADKRRFPRGETVTFDASGSVDPADISSSDSYTLGVEPGLPRGRIVDWHWRITHKESGAAVLSRSGSDLQRISYAFGQLGVFHISLTVTDKGGKTDESIVAVKVLNRPPEARFSWSTGCNDVVVLQEQSEAITPEGEVQLDAGGSYDPDADNGFADFIADYTWQIGNRGTVNGTAPCVRMRSGTVVTLTITDNHGDSDGTTQRVQF